jgi:hypothetical protein
MISCASISDVEGLTKTKEKNEKEAEYSGVRTNLIGPFFSYPAFRSLLTTFIVCKIRRSARQVNPRI